MRDGNRPVQPERVYDDTDQFDAAYSIAGASRKAVPIAS